MVVTNFASHRLIIQRRRLINFGTLLAYTHYVHIFALFLWISAKVTCFQTTAIDWGEWKALNIFHFLFFTNLSVSTWCNQHQLTRKLPSLLVVLFLKKQISDNYWKTPAAIEHEKTNKQSTFSYIFSHLPAILHIHRQKPSLNNNNVLCILSCCTTLLTDIQRKTQMEYWSIKVTLP